MASSLLIPAILLTILSFSKIVLVTSQREISPSICKDQDNNLICQVQEMKLKIAHLESVLEQSIQSLEIKLNYLREKDKLIEEMKNTIDFLHTVLANIKVDSADTEEKIKALEEEVRLLWAASRKNNFDIHYLESKAESIDGRIQVVTSKARKMEDIVTQQWILIRQLDQALKLTEVRALKAQRGAANRCTFLKFIKGISGHLPSKYSGMPQLRRFGKRSGSDSYVSQALHQLRNTAITVKKYHHMLQGIVKGAMESNEFTAAFANQEVIFFVASSLFIFPLWVAWLLLVSYFG